MNENGASLVAPWWVKSDLNGFFGLFTNVLTNLLVFSSLMIGIVKIPANIVFGRILPALGIAQLFGSLFYAYLARKLSIKENRLDVTALPYGLSVTHMFVVTFMVMVPILVSSGNPLLAWSAGVAWCFIEGVVEVLGAFIGPVLRKATPRAAILGTLSGVSITYIAIKPAMQVWEVPYMGFIALTIVVLGFLGNKVFPFKIPAGLVAIIAGTIVGWATGYMRLPELVSSTKDVGFFLPIPAFKELVGGFSMILPFLVTAIPLGVANFFETMSNVESASAEGDEYNTRACMIADGVGTLIGAVLGSPCTTSVYIGHPGWKRMGARIGYSIVTGVAIFVVCIFGMTPILLNIIPLVALLPILIYIGLVISAQAFQASPRKHAPAVMMAFLPWLANWGQALMDDALAAAGTNAQAVGYAALSAGNVAYRGMEALGAGAIVSGLILGAIVAFIIDNELKKAAIYAVAGAVLSFLGLIHATTLSIGAAPHIALGYILMAAVLILMDAWDAKSHRIA